MIRTAYFTAAVLLASTGLTFAQTSPDPAPPLATSGAAPASGLIMADKAPAPARFITMKPGNLTSDDLIGAQVMNNQNEALGEVEDVLIDSGKTVSGIVLSVGGFLGLGESYVLVDPSSVAVSRADGEDYKVVVDTTKDALKNAPKFTYPRE